MELSISSPDKLLYKGEARLIQFKGLDGYFEVLENHAPLISVLDKGKVRIVEKDDHEVLIDIESGVVEVSNNKVVLLCQ